jgi:demethylmenaquinone methyltransferase/2-methoxy-6-polyprenyl-1,4-benzoquinol methylase
MWMMNLDQVREVIYTKDGVQKKYDLTSNCYHLIMGVFEIKSNLEALDIANIKPGEKVLDAAFGTGWVLERIIQLIGLKEKVYGIDFSQGMHRVTQERLKRKKLENKVILIRGNVLSMPFKDESFDVIIASFLLDLQKISDISRLLHEINRVLNPKGRAIIVSMTKEGKGLKKFARCFYDWFYPLWPTIFGYRASSRPIYVEKEIKKIGLSINEAILSHIPIFHFPTKIVIFTKG